MELSESSPPFLQCIDSDPERAAREFYEWASRYFASCPPSVVSAIPREHRDTVFHDIIVDCIVDDFRVLRKYQDRGRPFAAWFLFVTRNRILDRVRSIKRTPDREFHDAADGTPGESRPQWEPVVHEHHTLKRIIEVVESCMGEMSEQCQILLRLTAEETSIPEILQQRLVQACDNKKMSGAIKYCQRKLRECVEGKGVEFDRIF